jgi:hypothetical protein
MRTPFLALIKWVFLLALVTLSSAILTKISGVWWVAYPCAFFAGMLFRISWLGILSVGLLSGALLWLLPSMLWIQSKGLDFFIALDQSMGLPGYGFGFLVGTGLLGGLMSTFGLVTGQSLLRLIKPKSLKKSYGIPDYRA